MKILVTLIPAVVFCGALFAKASLPGRLPDEYESHGGHELAFGQGGMAAVSEQSSVKMNPAMLSFEKQYRVSGGYHWPTSGRDFYQVGVVDSKTASFAAGVTYTAATSKYRDYTQYPNVDQREVAFYDSPVRHRVSLGLAQAFDKFSLGLGGQYVESTPVGFELALRGVTLGLGIAGLLTKSLRFGLSVENLANSKVQNIAPTTYRGGLALVFFSGDVTLHGDYSHRARVLQERLAFGKTEAAAGVPNTPEQLLTLSASARIQNLIRLMAAYGQSVTNIPRQSLSGGVALVNKNFSLSYLIARPFLAENHIHQAINLTVEMAF